MTAPGDRLLFVYGTLLPGEERWPFLERFVVGAGRPDSVPGRLFDTGEGYPAASFGPAGLAAGSLSGAGCGDGGGGAGRVHGAVFELAPSSLVEALAALDEVEDVELGLYRRVRVATDAGHEVWAYEYGTGLTLTPIDHGDWRAHRVSDRRDGAACR